MSPEPPPLDEDAVRRAYDAVAPDYAALLPDTRAESPLDLALVDAFAAAVAGSGDARALDAGCGAGRMSRYLADRGVRVQGVDLSPGMVAQARRHHADLTFGTAPLAALPFEQGAFDGVLLWYSVIHTPPAGLAPVLAEAVRVLRPGGHLLVGFQAGAGRRDLTAVYRRHGHDVRLDRHLHDPEQVAGQLRAAGARELARLVRRAEGSERDDQAVLLARTGDTGKPWTKWE